MAKRFRKVYIVCEDNKIFGCFPQITVYNSRDLAEYQCERVKKKAFEEKTMSYKEQKPLTKFKVHAFFLVHEDMFKN